MDTNKAIQKMLALWRLLDDIDTMDDAARDDDKAFRDSVRNIQRKRFQVLGGDEFDDWSSHFPTPEASN